MHLDEPQSIREGEHLNLDALEVYLRHHFGRQDARLEVAQFPSGYSNLTYLLTFGGQALVLRRPPKGAENISKGHDMGREFKVLKQVYSHFKQCPEPIIYCEDASIIGTPFFIMERVEGVIIRATDILTWKPEEARIWQENMVQTLLNLHSIDIKATGLETLGKVENYLTRQIAGWRGRWEKAKTSEIASMDFASIWLETNLPTSPSPALLHNDFKYDNVVLNAANLTEIKAVLDWEMATVGDPLTDLGIMLSYITEATDAPNLLAFNLKPLQGGLTRQEIADYYALKSGQNIDNLVYYYVFGVFKLGVIVQQIYYRYKMGYTKDKRFASLGHIVYSYGELAQKAIETGKITGI